MKKTSLLSILFERPKYVIGPSKFIFVFIPSSFASSYSSIIFLLLSLNVVSFEISGTI